MVTKRHPNLCPKCQTGWYIIAKCWNCGYVIGKEVKKDDKVKTSKAK